MKRFIAIVCLATLLSACESERPDAWIDRHLAENERYFGANPEVMVQRGLLADRKHRYIEFLATASGLGPEAPVTKLVGSPSDTSTDVLTRSVVSAADLRAALDFIGLSPGYPMDQQRLRYWPKGDRVSLTVYWSDADAQRFDSFAGAETLVYDRVAKTTLPEPGFRYVGPGSGPGDDTIIVSAFNSTNGLFEVPYTVTADVAASRLRPNPDYRFAAGQPLRIRLRPESLLVDGRVRDYRVQVSSSGGDQDDALSQLAVQLRSSDGEMLSDGRFEDAYVYLHREIRDGREPFVTFELADTLTAATVTNIAVFSSQFLSGQQVRIEQRQGEPHIGAFLPNEAWRDRRRRGASIRPLEIHLRTGSGGAAGELHGELLALDGETEIHSGGFASREELRARLADAESFDADGVFLFIGRTTPYAAIRSVFELLGDQHGNFYVFN